MADFQRGVPDPDDEGPDVLKVDAGAARFEGKPEFRARYEGTCLECGGSIEEGQLIRRDVWNDGYEHAEPKDCG